jgi:hypothetical protein
VLVEVDAPPQELREVRARCPRNHVSTGLGFDTPDDSRVRVEPTGWTGVRGFSFTVLNIENTDRPVQLQALCLSER